MKKVIFRLACILAGVTILPLAVNFVLALTIKGFILLLGMNCTVLQAYQSGFFFAGVILSVLTAIAYYVQLEDVID